MPIWLTETEHRILTAVCDRLIPGEAGAGDDGPGAGEAGAADYVDTLLGAFSFDPPRIWAGGPASGRHGGSPGFARFHRLGRLDELAWRTRIEGSRGIAERERNGPVVGLQDQYRQGLAALGGDFCDLAHEEQDARLLSCPDFTRLAYGHTCEAMYGAPEYGGNRDGVGWRRIGFAGDVQPRGWTDEEVAGA